MVYSTVVPLGSDHRGFVLGDAVYDAQLLDELPGSDKQVYRKTMERLLELPVEIVHGGHDNSFGRDRLREITRTYLDKS